MGKDIVERLREHADRVAGSGPGGGGPGAYDPETLALEHEAADEIEVLSGIVAALAAADEVIYDNDQGSWVCGVCSRGCSMYGGGASYEDWSWHAQDCAWLKARSVMGRRDG